MTKKIYDFILSCSWLGQYVQNCRVYNSSDFDSDHRLVIADLCTPCTKVARYKKQHLIPNKKHLNLNLLKDPDVQQNFLENAVIKLESIDLKCNNTMINEQFTTSINKSAEQTLPVLEKSRLYQPWHDDDVLKSLYDLKDQQIAKNADNKQLSNTRRKIRLRSKYLKNEYYKAEAGKINQSAISRELDKLFSRAKNQETTLKQTSRKCAPEKILEHFKNHFNPEDPSKTHVPNEFTQNLPDLIIQMQNISNHYPINHDAPSIEEIQTHLHRLKSVKTSNDVDPELLKICDHPVLLEVIHRMTSNLWSNLDIPDSWGNSRLKILWKGKGSKSDPAKYRGISIGSTVCKLIISIILERIRPWYEAQLSDEQNGFRKNNYN